MALDEETGASMPQGLHRAPSWLQPPQQSSLAEASRAAVRGGKVGKRVVIRPSLREAMGPASRHSMGAGSVGAGGGGLVSPVLGLQGSMSQGGVGAQVGIQPMSPDMMSLVHHHQ